MARTLATRMAFGQEIIEIAKTNETFVVCNADTKTCGLEKFGKYFPNREFSFGIAEQNLVAASAGLASCGNKVFLATFAVFASMRACEQVRTFVCYPNLNVTSSALTPVCRWAVTARHTPPLRMCPLCVPSPT